MPAFLPPHPRTVRQHARAKHAHMQSLSDFYGIDPDNPLLNHLLSRSMEQVRCVPGEGEGLQNTHTGGSPPVLLVERRQRRGHWWSWLPCLRWKRVALAAESCARFWPMGLHMLT